MHQSTWDLHHSIGIDVPFHCAKFKKNRRSQSWENWQSWFSWHTYIHTDIQTYIQTYRRERSYRTFPYGGPKTGWYSIVLSAQTNRWSGKRMFNPLNDLDNDNRHAYLCNFVFTLIRKLEIRHITLNTLNISNQCWSMLTFTLFCIPPKQSGEFGSIPVI